MSSIVRVLDTRAGITYVYNNESYWDKEKKAPRNRRTLIGKVDPETGEVVPTNGNRRRAMERKAEEAKEYFTDSIHALESEEAMLLQRYQEALEQFDTSLRNLEQDIEQKRKEIQETKQKLSPNS